MRVVIGRLSRPHGIGGEVAIEVRTDEPDGRFAAGAPVFCGQRELTVTGTRWHGSRLLVKFAEISDRDNAESLAGELIETDVDPADEPAADEEFYDYQLRGLAVIAAGKRVGHIIDVTHNDYQDALVVELLDSGDARQALIPFVSALIPAVDIDSGEIHVADVDGLLNPHATQGS